MPKATPIAMTELKLIALDEEDLAVVSSLLQDAVVRVADMTYLPRRSASPRSSTVSIGSGRKKRAAARTIGGGGRRSNSTACSAPN